MHPPAPSFSITIDRDGDDEALAALPAGPGVFAFEDSGGHALLLAVTANLRRLIRSRLAPPDDTAGPKRKVDYHALTHRVRALPVGCSFEADWACLQLARRLVPNAVKPMTDRWRGWWVHVNPEAEFPRFVKTSTPGLPPTGATGVHLGPIADKHAAARLIETLQSGFDLCRYHHILVQAPHGRACAYKEMGRCPAPCDGTVSMTHYHQQITDTVAFAADREHHLAQLNDAMHQQSEAMQFEAAEGIRRRIDDLAPAMKPSYRHVDRIDRFRWIAVCPGERPDIARVFVISGGWIAPLADVSLDASLDGCAPLAEAVSDCLEAQPVALDATSVQNIGLVCAHLFRPKTSAAKPIVFARCPGRCAASLLRDAMQALRQQLRRHGRSGGPDDSEDDVVDQIVESI